MFLETEYRMLRLLTIEVHMFEIRVKEYCVFLQKYSWIKSSLTTSFSVVINSLTQIMSIKLKMVFSQFVRSETLPASLQDVLLHVSFTE